MDSALLVATGLLFAVLLVTVAISAEMRHLVRHSRRVSMLLHAGEAEAAVVELEAQSRCSRPICFWVRRASVGAGIEAQIAVALHEVGETERAAEILDRLRDRAKKPAAKVPWALAQALVTVNSGRWDDSERAVEEGLAAATAPRDFMARASLLGFRAQRLISTIQLSAGARAAGEALAVDPRCSQARIMLGAARLYLGEFAEATRVLTEMTPTSVAPHVTELARKDAEARRFIEEQAVQDQTLQWVAGHGLAAYASIEAADLNGAEFYLTRAESVRAENPLLLAPLKLYRALLLAARRESAKARTALAEAEAYAARYPKRRPLHYEVNLVAGRVALLAGELDEAARRLYAAIHLSGAPIGTVAAYYHLAMVFRQKGDAAQARSHLEYVVKSAPEMVLARRAEALLGQL